MKEVFEKRSARINSRLMEKWGYKRDDKTMPPVRSAPLGQSIQGTEDEESQMSKPGYEEINVDDLVMEEEEIEEGTYGGNKGDNNTSAVYGGKSLPGAKDDEPVVEEGYEEHDAKAAMDDEAHARDLRIDADEEDKHGFHAGGEEDREHADALKHLAHDDRESRLHGRYSESKKREKALREMIYREVKKILKKRGE